MRANINLYRIIQGCLSKDPWTNFPLNRRECKKEILLFCESSLSINN